MTIYLISSLEAWVVHSNASERETNMNLLTDNYGCEKYQDKRIPHLVDKYLIVQVYKFFDSEIRLLPFPFLDNLFLTVYTWLS